MHASSFLALCAAVFAAAFGYTAVMPLLPELLSPLMRCIAYGLTNPSGHMREFLTIALPGFEWLTVKGFVIGLVKSFLYGALIGVVYVPIYNALQRRFGT